ASPQATRGGQDPLGMWPITTNLFRSGKTACGSTAHGFVRRVPDHEGGNRTFRWEGMYWTREILVSRLVWLAVAVGVTMVAALLFDRFDESRWSRSGGRRRAASLREAVAVAGPASALVAEPAPVPLHL